jgi:hypothetical protein
MSDAQRAVHEAIGDLLEDGEIAVCWTLTIDVAGSDNTRYLAHRAGGGADGTDNPMAWTALGMLRASMKVAESQVHELTFDTNPDDDDEDEE